MAALWFVFASASAGLGIIYLNLKLQPGFVERARRWLYGPRSDDRPVQHYDTCSASMVRSSPLVIRNLTSEEIILAKVERYPVPHRSRLPLCGRNGREPEPTSENFFLTIGPYESRVTDIAVDKVDQGEKLRLTFAVFSGRHFVHLPHTNTPDSSDTNTENRLFPVYSKSQRHLTLYQLTDQRKWMRSLRDDLLLSALSIPGTHNSPTCHHAAPSVRCQSVSPKEQLENGIRFFDMRMHPSHSPGSRNASDELVLVHGAFPISYTGKKTFRRTLQDIEAFLKANPSETLVLSIKREGPGRHTDAQISQVLFDHYAKNNHLWYTKPLIPTLGEARGKIVLLRRFGISEDLKRENDGLGWGIDASGWADNTPHAVCHGGHICIQDFYEVLKVEKISEKIVYINTMIARAAKIRHRDIVLTIAAAERAKICKDCPIHINFLSAANFWKFATWPKEIADRVNPQVIDYLCREHKSEGGDWSTGILVCDWVGHNGDWTLVKCIIGMNAWLKVDRKYLLT